MTATKKSIIRSAPKKKKVAVRTPRLADEKFTGPEPAWAGSDTWSAEKIHENWRNGLNYYNYHYVVADLIKYVRQYGTQNLRWTKDDVAAFNEVEDWRVGLTLAAACKMLLNGAPMQEETLKFITRRLSEVMELGRKRFADRQAQVKTTAKVVTIQDRMRDKLSDVIGEIEHWYDLAAAGSEVPDMVAWMREHNVPQQFVNQIADAFTPRMAELAEAIALRKKRGRTDDEDQLVEGYQHITKDHHKTIAAFYDNLTAALETYGAVKKAVRKARVKKAPSKEKLVNKVKYCAQHTELNLVSVNPVDILNSTALWVYNVKTRKLGRYVAASDSGTLGIKGSAIIGYDEKKSVAKTLRKPAEQLKSFGSAGKIALRTLLEDIKAVAVEMNGRLSKDIVLLKVIK